MDGTAVKEIAHLESQATVKIIDHLEGNFSTRPLYRLPLPERRKEEAVDDITVASLQAIVDYLEVQQDGLNPKTHFVHVEGPRSVRIVGSLLGQGETNQRHTYLRSEVSLDPLSFGRGMPVERMIVEVQSRYAETDDRDRLFRILGNLVAEESVKSEDDGVTQRVTAKTGVARREDVPVENPFVLAPRRTFREIDPPESPFVLRLNATGGEFLATLHEADGGAWELEAVSRIKEWLNDRDTGFRIIG